MKQYKTLDFFKFLAAVLIIVLHTLPSEDYSKVVTFGLRNIVCVIAVPFFFVCSGFVTFSKIESLPDRETKKSYIKKNLKRIALMYVIWSVIYFPFVIYQWTKTSFSYVSIVEYIRDFFFEGSYQTIWFLPALFTATLLVYLLNCKFSYIKIIFIAIPFYCFALLGSSYWGLTQNFAILNKTFEIYYILFDTIKNGLLFGFIYVAIGAWLAKNKGLLKVPRSYCIVGTFVCFILVAVEALLHNYFNLNGKGCDTTLCLIPMSISIMIFALNMELPFSEKTCLMFRKCSLLMFLVQRLPMSIIDNFMTETIVVNNSLIYFFVVFLTTMLLSLSIIKLSAKWEILKHLY